MDKWWRASRLVALLASSLILDERALEVIANFVVFLRRMEGEQSGNKHNIVSNVECCMM